MPFFSLIVG